MEMEMRMGVGIGMEIEVCDEGGIKVTRICKQFGRVTGA